MKILVHCIKIEPYSDTTLGTTDLDVVAYSNTKDSDPLVLRQSCTKKNPHRFYIASNLLLNFMEKTG